MSANEKLSPGMVLGRYELLLPIAQGGMATVWAARQKGSRGFTKWVAVKTMLPTLSDDPLFEKMFLDEAALAAKIHHPNVAQIIDLGEQDEILYIVMEWVDGEALSLLHKAARKSSAQVPIRIAMRIAAQACQGLHAAHELRDESDEPLGLVHRDVSPQNILVTYDGIVKLVDFGVAKATGRSGSETNAGQLKGKVPYMSPEQARGGVVDRRTDVFAMGIVLYKITTGIHPFLGENDLVTMRNIISRPLLPPRVKMPSYPQELEQVLMRCLQKDPNKRYDSMLDLGVALDRALTEMGVADDDVGGYIRLTLGERGNKRRSAMREAARAADERIATGVGLPIVDPNAPQPQQHDAISEIVLTAMSSGVHAEEILPDAPPSVPSAASSTNLVATAPNIPSIDPPSMPSLPPRSRAGVFVAAGGAVAALALVAALTLRSGPTPTTPVHITVNAGHTAGPDPDAPKIDAPPPAPVATTTASAAASASASAAPAADEAKPRPGPNGKPLEGRLPVATTSAPTATPTAAATTAPVAVAPTARPTSAPANPPAPKPTSTAWAPTVQNPGF